MGLSKKSQLVGIDIGSHSIKIVQLLQKKKQFELLNAGLVPLPENTFEDGMTKNPNLVSEAVKQLISSEKIKTKFAVISISGEPVVIKKINIPKMSEHELAESIKMEAEQYIPFDIKDVNIDFTILGTVVKEPDAESEDTDEQMEVLLVAAKKDIIEQRESILLNAGLKPVIFDLDVLAVKNNFSLNYGEKMDEVVSIVNIGASVTNIGIIEGGSAGFTRDILLGGNKFTETIQKQLKVDYEDAEKMKLGLNVTEDNKDKVISIIMEDTDVIASEIQKSIEFYSTAANRNVEKIFLSGGSSKISGINQLLSEKLGVSVETLDPLKKVSVNKKIFDPEYIDYISPMIAIATGLAIRRFDDSD